MKISKSRKKVLITAAAACLLSGGVIVYALSDTKLSKHEDNPMFPAEIEIAVQENGDSNTDPAAEKALQWEENSAAGTYSAEKKVQITNISQINENNADAYIRACIIPRWTAEVGTVKVDVTNSASGLSEFGSLTDITISDNTYIMGDVTFTLDQDWSDHWLFNPKDGYFYYKDIVSPDGTTAPLLERVSIGQKTWDIITETDEESGTVTDVVKLEVDILADAIQTVGGALDARWSASGIRIGTNGILELENSSN